MKYVIGIQPDDFGPGDASSPLWIRFIEAAGHEARTVDVRRADILAQLRGCHAFMWRFAHSVGEMQIARRLFPVLEEELGLVVYPDRRARWHFDDKIAQHYLFEALGIPTPKTWVFWDRAAAEEWARAATYPLVVKLARGAGSTNVALVSDFPEARRFLDRLFGVGVFSLRSSRASAPRRAVRAARAAAKSVFLRMPLEETFLPSGDWERQKDYVLFQQFLPGNDYDTRVTVIGRHVYGFRRFNRPNDFRASGSGRIDRDPAAIDPRFLDLGCAVAERIGASSVAIDGLLDAGRPVVGEMGYTYASFPLEECPGHWIREAGGLTWREGRMWPEEAHVEGLLKRLGDVQGR